MSASVPQIFYNFLPVQDQPATYIVDDLYIGTRGQLFKIPSKASASLYSTYREPSPKDIISRLPREVLLHILSFLTTSEAAKTSILSTQWASLWFHISKLIFHHASGNLKEEVEEERASTFVSRVNRALLLHEATVLDEFRVCLDFNISPMVVNAWIYYAFTKRVQRLELNFAQVFKYKGLPLYLSACEDWFSDMRKGYVEFIKNHLDLGIDFSSLRELSLTGVTVTDQFLNYLILICRQLERLTVVGTGPLDKVVVSSTSLEYLNITYAESVKSLEICCPNLRTLKLDDAGKVVLKNTHTLVEFHVYRPCCPLRNDFSSHFHQLEVLMLHSVRSKHLKRIPCASGFPILSKLKVLIINVGSWNDESLLGTTSFLQFCPNLQKFILQLFWVQPSRKLGPVQIIKHPWNLKHKHLKVVELSGYYGRKCEDELVANLSHLAVGLEKLMIDPRNNTSIPCVPTFDDIEESETARLCAKRQLPELVQEHVNLIIL